MQSEYATSSQLEDHKYGLRYVGYRFISNWKNLGFALQTLFCITKLVFIVSNILLFFAKNNNRCGNLRLRSRYLRLLKNISTPSYFNFEISSSIIQLTCAFVYLRLAKTYYGYKMSGTRILHIDMFLSITSLSSTLYLCIHLLVNAYRKEWWGLSEILLEKRGFYVWRHQDLMNYPH